MWHDKAARKLTGGVRVKMPKLKLLPRHMLYLLAQRILLETWIESSAVSLPDIYRQIMLDEKMFPTMTNNYFREAATIGTTRKRLRRGRR